MGSAYAMVPMPPAVAKLPRIGNMPVPWITAHEVDGQDPKRGDLAASGGPVLECRCELGVGDAVIGKQCPVRQRTAMVERLCSICGQHIDGAVIFVGISVSTSMPGADLVPVSMEAPTHPMCAAYSALVCPAIGGERAVKCALAIVSQDYTLVDRWIVPDPARPDRVGERFVPHGTPRTFLGRPIGCLDMVFARLDDEAVRFAMLAEWMPAAAPNPYRRLWRQRMEAVA